MFPLSLFIYNINTLASELGIQPKTLTYILYGIMPNNCYTQFEIPKKNGSTRLISAPNKQLMAIQRKLLKRINEHINHGNLQYKIFDNTSYGYEKNKNIYTNAQHHKNKRYVLNIDLESFFEHFHFGRVRGFFEKNKYFQLNSKIAIVIANLVCYQGTLPQGAPTSPIITNLICRSFDKQILNIAKQYKLHYTRYVDDLTFSTNEKSFIDKYNDFLANIDELCKLNGFSINQNKIKFQHNQSRQIVTGLCVNKKINTLNSYYKNTRAMANALYSTNSFTINSIEATVNQLTGRFNFINYIDKQNNINAQKNNTINSYKLNKREIEYKKFLFYKYFLANEHPLIITEGKTDEKHIKAALKKYYKNFPELITFNESKFLFNIKFLKRTTLLKYLFAFSKDGADSLQNLCLLYRAKQLSYQNKEVSFYDYFKEKYGITPNLPVIFIMDNELTNKDKPIRKFLNGTNNGELIQQLKDNFYIQLKNSPNMFLVTLPMQDNMKECEIEDLHTPKTLNITINNKQFNKNGGEEFYGKDTFANYIAKNYYNIDMKNFQPVLNIIKLIINQYNKDIK